jgi:uncharacterized membrane protein YidH (DUF202 family)
MRITLRSVLAILAAGLAVEGIVSLFLYLGGGFSFAVAGVILGLGPILALVGLLILWVGRSRWNQIAGQGLHAADVAFGASFLAMAAVAGIVGWYAYLGASTIPPLSLMAFGLAVGASLFLTFATFALIAYGLSGAFGRVSLGLGLTWAAGVSAWLGLVLAQEIRPILQTVESRSMNIGPLSTPVIPLELYLAPAYVLILIAYLDAIRRTSPRPAGTPGAGSTRHAV